MRGGEGESLFLSEGAENLSTCSLLDIFIIYLFKLYGEIERGKQLLFIMSKIYLGKYQLPSGKGDFVKTDVYGDELDLFSIVPSPDSLPVKVSLHVRLFSYWFITSPDVSHQNHNNELQNPPITVI